VSCAYVQHTRCRVASSTQAESIYVLTSQTNELKFLVLGHSLLVTDYTCLAPSPFVFLICLPPIRKQTQPRD